MFLIKLKAASSGMKADQLELLGRPVEVAASSGHEMRENHLEFAFCLLS